MMTEGVDLTLVIRKANGQLTVSLLPKSNGLKDEAQNHLVPLTVSGHPQELDAGFLQAVARPIQKTTGLISNMAQFEAQAEKAASESKAAKETKAKETKEEKEKREKYEKHFKKAEELIAAKNHIEPAKISLTVIPSMPSIPYRDDLTVNTFMPNGGVIIPVSIAMIITRPNHTKS